MQTAQFNMCNSDINSRFITDLLVSVTAWRQVLDVLLDLQNLTFRNATAAILPDDRCACPCCMKLSQFNDLIKQPFYSLHYKYIGFESKFLWLMLGLFQAR